MTNLQNQPTNPKMLTKNRMLDPLDPGSFELNVDEIAEVLSKICRFGGHTSRFYSVAEHSLWCASVAHRDYNMKPSQMLYVLCHDVAEVVVGDIIRPLKKLCPQEVLDAEDTILENFLRTIPFNDKQWAAIHDEEFVDAVREIDTRMAMTEAEQLLEQYNSIEGVEAFEDTPLNVISLPEDVVRESFMEMFAKLMLDMQEEDNEAS